MAGTKPRGVKSAFIVIFVLVSAFFLHNSLPSFGGGSDGSTSATSGSGQYEPQTTSSMTLQTVTLRGEDICSGYVDLDDGPRGENYVEGPVGTRIHWEDGTVGLITDWFGAKGGNVCFTGPAGEKVTVRQVPHGA